MTFDLWQKSFLSVFLLNPLVKMKKKQLCTAFSFSLIYLPIYIEILKTNRRAQFFKIEKLFADSHMRNNMHKNLKDLG